MKNSAMSSVIFLSVLSLSAVDVEARGFGGGARMGGGGMVHSAPVMSHSAGFSRPAGGQVYQPSHAVQRSSIPQSRPQAGSFRPDRTPESGFRPQTRPDGTHRPTESQVQNFLNLPKPSEGRKPGLGTIGAVAGGAAGALALQHLTKPDGEGIHRPGQGPGDRPGFDGRPGTDRPRRDVNVQVAQHVRNNYVNRYDNMFNRNWWQNHPRLASAYSHNGQWHHHDWHHWWRPAAWVAVAGWFPWGWGSPVSYDYGDNIYYDNDSVYMNGEPVATAGQYYDQAAQLASAPQSQDADSGEWMPLGVFALSQGDTGASNTVLQLAVSKDGSIEGNYYNVDTDTARPIKGSVDKTTQRAAWTFNDGKNTDIVMEAGIYNLTQDQTEALVHFGKDKTQKWVMVRLPEPGGQDREAGTGDAASE
ncbi:MAG TPA: hypothetical protein VK463_09420 [Desulfomonilaceae bacterium]|nr:hypothetical protein [Desulfomonilaceae bacterium]